MLNFKIRVCNYLIRLINGLMQNSLPLLKSYIKGKRTAYISQRIEKNQQAYHALEALHVKTNYMQSYLSNEIAKDTNQIK